MNRKQKVTLKSPARLPRGLGSGFLGYVSGPGFGVFDAWRGEHFYFEVPDTVSVGSVVSAPCPSGNLVLVFFANEKFLHVYPLFPACDKPFENSSKAGPGLLEPSNALEM